MGKLRLRVCPDSKREKAGLRPLGTCQNPSPAHLQFLGHPCSWSRPSLRAEGPPLACRWTLRPVSSPLAQGWAKHHTQEAFRGQGGHLAQTRNLHVAQLPPVSHRGAEASWALGQGQHPSRDNPDLTPKRL